MKHYIKIEEINNKYRFELWYCGKQYMGYSKEYDSYEQCLKGLENFKKFLIINNIENECNFLKLIKINIRNYIYQFIDENNNVLYTSRNIETKGSCRDSMLSTCKNIRKADIKK